MSYQYYLTWLLIYNSLQHNIAVMLLYVLESKGSSPGRQGFIMAVNAKGEMNGSMGGGIMEHKFVEMAKVKLLQEAEENTIHYQIHDKTVAKNQSGMICSGEQTIFLYTVKKEEVTVIKNIIAALQQNKNASLQLSPSGIIFSEIIPNKNYELQVKGDNDFSFTEKLGYKNTLYIIGGGHCSLALSQLMSNMDFYIHLYDHREELNTVEQNRFANEKHVVNDFTELSTLIPSSQNSFVVIMTVGYRTDAATLKALAGKDFAYVGVLGSQNKIKKMFEQLVTEGVNKDWLGKTHAPIGIPIKSQTPEEIAISIAAEIIKIKNKNL